MEFLIISIALANQIDPNLLLAVCYKETKLHQVINVQDGHSPSYGICQIKKIAARQVASVGDVTNLEDSIDIAAKYLSYNLKRCHNIAGGLVAYNRGKCGRPNQYTEDVMIYYELFQDKYPMYVFN